MIDDLKYIKKFYGENFAHLCRTLFPTVLETEGLLSQIITDNFAPTKSLYDDLTKDEKVINDFRNYVFSKIDIQNQKPTIKVIKSPEELMDEAGYILYPECKTEENIQSFRKYWDPYEALCTFNGGRLKYDRVWFAIKKNVAEIKRKDFKNPKRQDEYGTSAISIQFTKTKPALISIKNRYNHTVENPDATFGNNLENIIPGLTEAFMKNYSIYLASDFYNSIEIPGYVRAIDGRFYRSNFEHNDIYYCENNVIINHGNIQKFDKREYILIDDHVVDKKLKAIDINDNPVVLALRDKIEKYDEVWDKYKKRILTLTLRKDETISPEIEKIIKELEGYISLNDENKIVVQVVSAEKGNDSFAGSIGAIEKITENFDENKNRLLTITPKNGEEITLTIDSHNEIIGYNNPNVKEIDDKFMQYNIRLKIFVAPKLQSIGDNFLKENKELQELFLPCIEDIGDNFIEKNKLIDKFIAPNLKSIGDDFMGYNKHITELNLENLEEIGDDFMGKNTIMTNFNAPKLTKVGDSFCPKNHQMEELILENLTHVGEGFLRENRPLKKFVAPKLKFIDSNFMCCNISLEELTLESLEEVESHFLSSNEMLKKLTLPKLKNIGSGFLYRNNSLKILRLDNVEAIGRNFMYENNSLITLIVPKLTYVDYDGLRFNETLQNIFVSTPKKHQYFCSFNSEQILPLEENENEKSEV